MFISDYCRRYSSLLVSRSGAICMVIVSVFIAAGLFVGAGSSLCLREFIVPLSFHLSFVGRLLLIYFSITVLFALGLSQAGFAVIPILSVFKGFVASLLLYNGINGDSVELIFAVLPFIAVFLISDIIYGAFQLKTSWNFFSGIGYPEVLDTLQYNIKLYYFTLAVFALMTAVISGLGYIIPFLYRSLF